MRRRVIAGMALILEVFGPGLPSRAQDPGEWEHGFGARGKLRRGPALLAILENERVKTALGLTEQ